MDEQIDEQIQEAFNELAQIISDQFLPVLNRFFASCKILYQALWDEYRNAGEPYGETVEGLSRWIKEMGEIERAKEFINETLSFQKACVSLRIMRLQKNT